MKKLLLNVVCVVGLTLGAFFVAASAQAGLYIQPQVGYAIGLDEGDADFSAGAKVGYQFLDYFASVGVGYARIFSDPDTDLIELTGTLGLPVIPIYGIIGFGLFQTDTPGTDWESSFRLGAGFHLPFIPVIDLGAELSYLNLGGDTHLLQPMILVGLKF